MGDRRTPLLGGTVETGPEIHWRRDYGSGIETDTRYFRRIPFLDAARAGDHKSIWELNRHQHLVLLAQAGLLTGEERYFQAIGEQLESWFAANPFQRGINWSSALEVAFRALSWMWLYHLAGSRLPGAFLEAALPARAPSRSKPVALLFSQYPSAWRSRCVARAGTGFGRADWERDGARVIDQQMERQVREDGSHFEQSTYYHVYALDMFLFHSLLRRDVPPWRPKLERMADIYAPCWGADAGWFSSATMTAAGSFILMALETNSVARHWPRALFFSSARTCRPSRRICFRRQPGGSELQCSTGVRRMPCQYRTPSFFPAPALR